MKQGKLSQNVKRLAGKTDPSDSSLWLPLWMHLCDTAGIMKCLFFYWLPQSVRKKFHVSEEELEAMVSFLGMVHDIGKATALFQYNISRNSADIRSRIEVLFSIPREFLYSKKSPHARASEAILLKMGCPAGLASIAGAHHGKPQVEGANDFIDTQIEQYEDNYYGLEENKNFWEEIWRELFDWALFRSGFSSAQELPLLSIAEELLLSGLLIMADWLASNSSYFPLISLDELGTENMYPSRIDTAWEKIGLTTPWDAEYCAMDEEVFLRRFGFAPNEVQRSMVEIASDMEAPGILVLEAQMGVGKTEAALAAAEILAARFEEGGLYFGLPTQATANGIFDRLKGWAATQSEEVVHTIRLAHGMAELNEEYRALFQGQAHTQEEAQEDGLLVHSWFQGAKQALLADFVIGTVDQLLLAGLKQKHIMLRHLGLAGKIVIVDECHAYDAYMNHYLKVALAWLGKYRVPVILLSATLPAKRRVELIEAYLGGKAEESEWKNNAGYPLLTWTNGKKIEQRNIALPDTGREIEIAFTSEEEVPDLLKDWMQEGGCAGVIVNTVKKAQELARRLAKSLPDFDVLLFHAQFVMPDRADKESELLARLGKNSSTKERNRVIVVGTQVLEQSLDIDFDLLLTELCPMDLLLQRIGRLHRHFGRAGRPHKLRTARCFVLDSKGDNFDSGSKAIYGEWLLWRTRNLLPSSIILPQDIPKLVQQTYSWEQGDSLPEDEKSKKAKDEYDIKQEMKEQRANRFSISPPEDRKKPERNVLDNWMADLAAISDAGARAAVRDGDPSIDVLVMVSEKDGSVHFLPWQENGQAIAVDTPPSQEICQKIARQKLRLPGFFGRQWNIDGVIEELEERTYKTFSQWQQTPMLKGELVLLLDGDFKARLGKMELQYDKVYGLSYQKEEENEGNGV